MLRTINSCCMVFCVDMSSWDNHVVLYISKQHSAIIHMQMYIHNTHVYIHVRTVFFLRIIRVHRVLLVQGFGGSKCPILHVHE